MARQVGRRDGERPLGSLTLPRPGRHPLWVTLRRLPGLCALLALVLAASPALATVTTALDLRELVTRADLVTVATALHRESRWDARRRIVTDVTLRVDQVFKGEGREGSEIVVRRLGGAIGDLGMQVAGAPSFEDGQRSLIFAERRGGHLRAVGMSQGVMRIRVDLQGRELVLPGGSGLSLVRRVPGGALTEAPAALLAPRPLGDLLDEVRRTVDETRGN